jgi:pimeloyl-ACP methyl ester carboxylesterase
MPFATNPLDGVRTYFEDDGGNGPPVLVYPGFSDPIAYARQLPLSSGLAGEFRLIFADHRGQGRSDKPHDAASYALPTRTADAVAIVDELGIERVHFLGLSWGARLGFSLGEHAPERLRSLVLCGNQPYAWNTDGPLFRSVSEAIAAGARDGIAAFVETWEEAIGERFPEPGRTWMFDNDPLALQAAFSSAALEGPVSKDLSAWRTPCLIYCGEVDPMFEDAKRGASEIPGALFISTEGEDHFSAERVTGELLPEVIRFFRSVEQPH